ncbi:MAG: type II toxin-antitoxin system HipA family toxin [Proteobacteria bacterium]|nr:type II toxin-antitoxin system HipA family toxin [Pseudomonadota bacterium]MBU1581897.1 type II toxin-antitoxin system HipA family toxin [Pseudomonadota bacterium]MBU2456176.1 type II toxin-antitoxin system HipA family toxin [Pseudomonadota bacterium]MBU2628773.1 type II toxin-antitoxin system HipA family toxin [Pseudomonadota bacterium]
MVKKIDTAVIRLWGDVVGAVTWLEKSGYGIFEYDPSFLKKNLDISPLHMGLEAAARGNRIFSFPGLGKGTFMGLPGLLADVLPDKFGNAVINSWLAGNGRSASDFSPIERLCYTGKRGMGALEFYPPVSRKMDRAVPVEISSMVALAQTIMQERSQLDVDIGSSEKENSEAILDILRVGTSAGGARPKAVIAMDGKGHVISGQSAVPKGYEYWILKFDGVDDIELGKPRGYGRIEYAYALMAKAAGIDMTECRLLEENGRAHFLTKRFDRVNGAKLHLQSLCGLAHYDFNAAGAYSYEQVFSVMRQLRLTKAAAVQQYRRMVFNVIGRNQDDHTKNIAFLMTPQGQWRLSPAFDVMYSHNPAGKWTQQHQMTINGKQDDFTRADLIEVGKSISISKPAEIIDEILDSVNQWPDFAKAAGVKPQQQKSIARYHRTDLK